MNDFFMEVDGCKIRYYDTGGDGPVILLTHGVGASLETWEGQLNAAKDHPLRLIAWDVPGHGLSDLGDQPYNPPKYAKVGWRLLDALGVDKAILAGNSMGGAISVHMAGLQPQRALKLVLLNAASLGRESPLPFRLMTLPLLGRLMNRPNKMAVDQQISAIFYEKFEVPESVRKTITRNVMRPGAQEAFLAAVREMSNFSGQRPELVNATLSALKSLTVPVLFIHGREDLVIPVQHSADADKLTPNSRLIILEECGHTPQIEMPEAVFEIVLDFALEPQALV